MQFKLGARYHWKYYNISDLIFEVLSIDDRDINVKFITVNYSIISMDKPGRKYLFSSRYPPTVKELKNQKNPSI